MKGPRLPRRRGPRDAEASRAAILQAALGEFSAHGFDGARVDRIAAAAGLSKPMLYGYFGDKDELYRAALREAYVQIRRGEQELDLLALSPEEAIAALVRFTTRHYLRNPWFIAILNTENLRGGTTVRTIPDRHELQSNLLEKLSGILRNGYNAGVFRRDVEAVDLYLIIASLCYFPVSNRFTLEAAFGLPLTEGYLHAHSERVVQMVVHWLKSDGDSFPTS